MQISLFLEITISVCTLIGMVFLVFNYFKTPQIDSDKNDALMAQTIQQLRVDFSNLRDNHVHTLDTKLDQTISNVATIATELAKLSTIIDERIPKKI